MATEMTTERTQTKCPSCELAQFRPQSGNCRRCGAQLLSDPFRWASVSVASVVVRVNRDKPGEIVPMRTLMQRAAVDAVAILGATTKAAKALGIPHSRIKQLLREGGDHTDYRKTPRRKVAA